MIKSILKNGTVFLLSLTLSLLLAEGFVRLLDLGKPAVREGQRVYQNRKYLKLSEGSGLLMCVPGEHSMKLLRMPGGEVIYDVVYSISDQGNRITPPFNPANDEKAAVFLGGSFTAGQGVENNETIPYYFAANLDNWRSYNYALHGGGPFDMLARLELLDFPEISGEVEAVIYVFPIFHLERMTGSFMRNRWNRNHMYYGYDPAGNRFFRKGPFREVFPFRYWLLGQAAKSRLISLILNRFKFNVEPAHLQRAAALFSQMAEEAGKKFPQAGFFLVLYPGGKYPDELLRLLEKDERIHILDYSRLFKNYDERFYLAKEDRHPSPYANRILAERLAKDIHAFTAERQTSNPEIENENT